MDQKEIVLQIFTGGYRYQEADKEAVKQKLQPVLKKLKVSKVIIGWALDALLYQEVEKLVHSYGAELYLWLPVFSETGLLEPVSLLQDCFQERVKSFQLKDGENFEFYCPNVSANREAVKRIYEKYFQKINFDGVFLDKIRYASFANRIEGVFSCFCPECRKRYQEMQLDDVALQTEIKKVLTGTEGYGELPFNCKGYENGRYKFKNPVWEQFFSIKAEIILTGLADLSSYFRANQLKIGMDVFSPFMAYFVGQDLQKLQQYADFMKPMMYRITNAPAGLPFEYEKFLKIAKKQAVPKTRIGFDKILGIQTLKEEPFDMNFVKEELRLMNKWQIPVYCGMEINYVEEIVSADPKYIREMMSSLAGTEIDGYVLSWNLLSAPEENLEAVYSSLENRGE